MFFMHTKWMNLLECWKIIPVTKSWLQKASSFCDRVSLDYSTWYKHFEYTKQFYVPLGGLWPDSWEVSQRRKILSVSLPWQTLNHGPKKFYGIDPWFAVLHFSLQKRAGSSWCRCYKTFFLRNLRIFVINWVFVHCKPLQPSLLFVGKARSLPYCGASEWFFNRVGSCFTNRQLD